LGPFIGSAWSILYMAEHLIKMKTIVLTVSYSTEIDHQINEWNVTNYDENSCLHLLVTDSFSKQLLDSVSVWKFS
jgi:hypothetical protein